MAEAISSWNSSHGRAVGWCFTSASNASPGEACGQGILNSSLLVWEEGWVFGTFLFWKKAIVRTSRKKTAILHVTPCSHEEIWRETLQIRPHGKLWKDGKRSCVSSTSDLLLVG